MNKRRHPEPKKFDGVMVSSTFEDLEEERGKVIDVIERQGMKAIAMEYDSAKPDTDIIRSSLDKVDACAGYVVIIGIAYGRRPKCSRRNKQKLSITELEFRRARRLRRPSLVFIMGEDHKLEKRSFDKYLTASTELIRFIELAKKDCIYAEFQSIEDLERKATQSVAELRWHLYMEQEQRRKALLGLFEGAQRGIFSEGDLDLTEFEDKALRYIAKSVSRKRKDTPR